MLQRHLQMFVAVRIAALELVVHSQTRSSFERAQMCSAE
jgi:hypothetical protein